MAGPAHLRGGHGARVLPGHLRGHGRGHRWANDGISGDGFLYTGGAAYEEAVGEWEGEQANIEAYLAAAEEDGIDVEGATAALEAEEPTAADESALAAFQEDAEKAGVVGIVEDRGDRRIRRGGRRGLCNRPRS
ncbi:MAG: hypothetical protein ACLSGS_04645 [Adlercreutzia sp.]